MNLVVAATSKEYIKAKVIVRKDGVVFNPSALPVYWLFAAPGAQSPEGASTDWKLGDWENDNGTYYARYLLPGTMTRGGYRAWLKVSDSAEVPIKSLGLITLI